MPSLFWILAGTALLITVMSSVWMVVLGFQRHTAWGLGLLVPLLLSAGFFFLPPGLREHWYWAGAIAGAIGGVVYLTFLVLAWPEAQRPFFWSLTSLVLLGVAWFSRPGARAEFRFGTHWSVPPKFVRSPETPATPPEASPAPLPDTTMRGRTFQSHLPPTDVLPGEQDPAPPGVYYLLERVTKTTTSGLKAANVGEKAILIDRLPGSKLRVMVDGVDFVVGARQVSSDMNAARAAEKREFMAHGGQL